MTKAEKKCAHRANGSQLKRIIRYRRNVRYASNYYAMRSFITVQTLRFTVISLSVDTNRDIVQNVLLAYR